MKLETFQYRKNTGWSVEHFPAMDSENTLILIFASPSYIDHADPIKELASHYPHSKMIGCSSAGEIFGAQIVDESISVAIVQFEKTILKIVRNEIKSSDESYNVGKEIADKLNHQDLRSIFVLSEGLNVNGSELVKGINALNNKDVVITGGLAGDGSNFKQTWAIFNGEIFKNNVIAVGLYGDHVQIGHGSRGGWDIFGPERRITKSKKNILYELDNKPALTLYKEYLGDRASGLPATGLLYPLAIRQNRDDSKQLVRTILAVNEDEQSLTFAGDVPQGYLAQLMRANFDRLISAADEAGDLAQATMLKNIKTDTPILVIAISCIGRRLLLGERTEEETEATLASLPAGSKQIGFYSYGELCPYTKGDCDLHNQTMTLTTIIEN